MIKYQFAYNNQKNIIDILTLSRENKSDYEPFSCLSCGRQLIPILGTKRIKHFRHKVTADLNCSPETYLHILAKSKFYDVYLECLNSNESYDIEINIQEVCNFYKNEFLLECSNISRLKKFDLTKYFDSVSLEKREGNFIPDVILRSTRKNELIFVEIVVTHSASVEKIKSGHRIIEIYIDSEQDVNIINSRKLEESKKVKFINFKNKDIGPWCKGACLWIKPYASEPVPYPFFVVYKNGKSAILTMTVDKLENQTNLLYSNLAGSFQFFNRKREYILNVINAHKKGIKIRNCFLCRYHAENKSFYRYDNPIFCKFLKSQGKSNMASNCQYFKIDHNAYSEYE